MYIQASPAPTGGGIIAEAEEMGMAAASKEVEEFKDAAVAAASVELVAVVVVAAPLARSGESKRSQAMRGPMMPLRRTFGARFE
jgi:hypothetical protein